MVLNDFVTLKLVALIGRFIYFFRTNKTQHFGKNTERLYHICHMLNSMQEYNIATNNAQEFVGCLVHNSSSLYFMNIQILGNPGLKMEVEVPID